MCASPLCAYDSSSRQRRFHGGRQDPAAAFQDEIAYGKNNGRRDAQPNAASARSVYTGAQPEVSMK
jgi:hypothetical protein